MYVIIAYFLRGIVICSKFLNWAYEAALEKLRECFDFGEVPLFIQRIYEDLEPNPHHLAPLERCPVCLDLVHTGVRTGCGHNYCITCAKNLIYRDLTDNNRMQMRCCLCIRSVTEFSALVDNKRNRRKYPSTENLRTSIISFVDINNWYLFFLANSGGYQGLAIFMRSVFVEYLRTFEMS